MQIFIYHKYTNSLTNSILQSGLSVVINASYPNLDFVLSQSSKTQRTAKTACCNRRWQRVVTWSSAALWRSSSSGEDGRSSRTFPGLRPLELQPLSWVMGCFKAPNTIKTKIINLLRLAYEARGGGEVNSVCVCVMCRAPGGGEY